VEFKKIQMQVRNRGDFWLLNGINGVSSSGRLKMKGDTKEGWDDESENMSRAKCKEERERQGERERERERDRRTRTSSNIEFNSRFPRRKIKLYFSPKDERWHYY
jgi:hypothetical protein